MGDGQLVALEVVDSGGVLVSPLQNVGELVAVLGDNALDGLVAGGRVVELLAEGELGVPALLGSLGRNGPVVAAVGEVQLGLDALSDGDVLLLDAYCGGMVSFESNYSNDLPSLPICFR